MPLALTTLKLLKVYFTTLAMVTLHEVGAAKVPHDTALAGKAVALARKKATARRMLLGFIKAPSLTIERTL